MAEAWRLWRGETLGETGFLFTASPFAEAWPNWALAFLVGLGCALFWWGRLRQVPTAWRAVLVGLRAAAAALFVFVVLGPAWTLRRAVPGQEAVVVLYDDSRSMRLPGGDGQTRGQRLRQVLGDGAWSERLRQGHPVVEFSFGRGLGQVDGVGDLDFSARVTDLPGAVARALARTAPAPVAAVVLFSDGVQQSGTRQGDAAQDLTALPEGSVLLTVGVGSQEMAPSLALQALRVGRPDGEGTVDVEGVVRAVGQAGERLVFEVFEGGRILASTAVEAQAGLEEYAMQVSWTPGAHDWRAYRARVRLEGRVLPDPAYDPVVEDNSRGFLLDLRDRTYRILYFAGRPGWEFKFVRRALAGDPNLQLGGLVRISGAERRFVFGSSAASLANPLYQGFGADAIAPRYDESVFMRLGLQPGELEDGYPQQAEDLFPFHLVVWDGIEADFFAPEQLQLSRAFVERRGGAFLMLGGRHLAGFAGTPLEPVLPVVLQAGFIPGPLRPQATIEGFLSGVWSLDGGGPRLNSAAWSALPPLAAANRFALARAGAEVLARVGAGRPFFAWQRYGEGRGAVLGASDTWRWHMGRAEGDEMQARFWRRLVRGLVEGVPERAVLLQAERPRLVGVGDSLAFRLRDARFAPAVGRLVVVELEGPAAGRRQLPVEESLEEPGTYRAALSPETAGLHRLSLRERTADGSTELLIETAVLVEEDHREMVGADYDPAYLAELAREGGGTFVPLERLDEVSAHIPRRPVYSEEVERFGLWQMPPVYVLLAALLLVEWWCRRRRGLP